MKLRYDNDIETLEEALYWRNFWISEVNNVDFLTEQQKQVKISIIENRKIKIQEEINQLKELQKPIDVGLIL